jgi:hypothetical protein
MYDGPKRSPASGLIPSVKGKPVQDLQARLTRLCLELAQLEYALKQAARQSDGRPIEICNEQVLNEAKSAVDRIRHLLWPYVEAAAKRAAGLDEALQRYRMERITSMLNELTDRVAEPGMAETPEVQSFFSSIQEIATTAVEKHLQRDERSAMVRPLSPTDPKTLLN